MKLDRRTFIEIAVGAALGAGGGITLSPLPWKLTDDIAIWTQNWPWTPVPPVGEATHAHTVCSLCPGGCGITLRKVGSRAVKIEGREGYPVNDGGICPLGAAGLQLLYGPWRVPGPARPAGEPGSGAWEKIPWDQAIKQVVTRLADLRSNGMAHTVACMVRSDRGTVPQLFSRFMKAYGSPNFIRTASAEDTNELAVKLTQGKDASVGYDLERADFILSFGSGLVEGWGSPVRVIKAHSKWRSDEKTKLVQIEPRLSNTAAKADMWVPINPGTETALALGLAHVIIRDGLYDAGFVANETSEFSAWRDLVLGEYGPQKVSETTGLSAAKIADIARAFAKAEHPVAVWGRGKGTSSGSLYECMAVQALNALVGNINKPGGLTTLPEVDTRAWQEFELDAVAVRGNGMPRLDGAGSQSYPLTKYRPDQLPKVINDNPGAIQMLLVCEADPYFTTMDRAAMAKAFEKIPFVVSFSTYFDETAHHASLILPNHHYLERWEDVPTPIGLQKPVLGLRKPALSPTLDTMHAGDAIITIAKQLGGTVGSAFPWKNYETALKETLADQWDTLVEQGYAESPGYQPSGAFGTPSGKFQFYGKAQEPVKLEGNSASYPLTLIPVELIRLPNDAVGSPPFCTKTVEETELKGNSLVVEVNPKTAYDYGLAEGREALLETPKGEARVLIHLSEGIMPGLAGMPKGLGHTGDDAYLAGKGASVNSLMGVVEDPISGLCATWGIRARLTSV